MAEKSVIIIGAGIAGLTSGTYARLNGYQTQIFEMGIKPGGLCTNWERKGYIIDGCLHWLVGSSPQSSYHHMWQEVGALQGKTVVDLEQFMQVETFSGKTVTFYSDLNKLEKHLLEIAPEDAAVIADFIKAVRKCMKMDMSADKAPELYNIFDNIKMMLKMAPYMGEMQKWGKVTTQEFASRFKNPDLKEAFLSLWPADYSMLFLLFTLAWTGSKNAGYVIGGSMELSLAMEKRYCELGGKINYRSGVEKILVENGKAVGVKLADGTEHKADYVISCADGHATIWDMLEGKYVDQTIESYYKMPIFQPLVYIGLGVKRTFNDMPQTISGYTFPLDKSITVSGTENKALSIQIRNFDPSFAPEGKTVLTTAFSSNFEYWAELSQDMAKYKAEKERIAVAVVAALEKRFPGIAKQVEMWDVSTPLTFFHYTGNWQGSFEGFLLTPQNLTLRMKKTLPGLDNFYMAGHWVQPGGGLPSALMAGCHVIQLLCKKDKNKFQAAVPKE